MDAILFFRGWAPTIVVMAANSGHSCESAVEAMQDLEEQDPLSAGALFGAEVQEIFNAAKGPPKPTRQSRATASD